MMGFGFLIVLLVLGMPLALIAALVIWLVNRGAQKHVVSASALSQNVSISSTGQVCSHCGASLQRDWSHCPHCGAAI